MPEQQALAAQQIVNRRQNAVCQLVFVRLVTKSQNSALVR